MLNRIRVDINIQPNIKSEDKSEDKTPRKYTEGLIVTWMTLSDRLACEEHPLRLHFCGVGDVVSDGRHVRIFMMYPTKLYERDILS